MCCEAPSQALAAVNGYHDRCQMERIYAPNRFHCSSHALGIAEVGSATGPVQVAESYEALARFSIAYNTSVISIHISIHRSRSNQLDNPFFLHSTGNSLLSLPPSFSPGRSAYYFNTMLSIRAFARSSALRSTFRIASYSTRTNTLRPAFQSTLCRNTTPKLSPRHLRAAFSTTTRRLDDAAQELGAKLQSEIQLEAENTESSADSDGNVKAFLDQNDWQVTDRDGEQDIILHRKYDDEDITVSFSIADFNTPSVMPEDEADEAFVDEDEDVNPPARSGGAGSINQARSTKEASMAAEDSVAPSDREEVRGEEVNTPTSNVIVVCND